ALGLVVTALCGHFCIACLRPLTRRYVFSNKLAT
ncbi:VOC family protein, partial [Vibrio mimicus]